MMEIIDSPEVASKTHSQEFHDSNTKGTQTNVLGIIVHKGSWGEEKVMLWLIAWNKSYKI